NRSRGSHPRLRGPHPPTPSPNAGRGGVCANPPVRLRLSCFWERGLGGEGLSLLNPLRSADIAHPARRGRVLGKVGGQGMMAAATGVQIVQQGLKAVLLGGAVARQRRFKRGLRAVRRARALQRELPLPSAILYPSLLLACQQKRL